MKSKIKLIVILSIVLLLFFTSLSIYMSYIKIKGTVEESIANQNLEAAKSIAASIDIETYKKFLLNPVENKHYWEIRSYLNDAREKTGSLYVYTLAINNPKVATTMIVGMPESLGETHPIGEDCTVPEEQVKMAYAGKTYVTGLIEDPKYGTYLSTGAPIKDKEGRLIGYLGIDVSANTINNIGGKILKNSISILIFNGIFILVIILSFFFMQRWYQKEVTKEVEDTEDTYQIELKTLIASISSLRHDFINHIQVLHGLLKLGESSRALEYVSSLFKEVQMIGSIKLDIDDPGLSVLLQTKKITAQNHNIDMQLTIAHDSFNKMKTTDLIKILSNLIDNAIDATLELPEDARKIIIDCKTTNNQYVFKITNTGPKIIEKEHIFKQGYSTKKEVQGKIRGHGLFIVKEVVNKYKGSIWIDSTEVETTAIVEIPIKS